MPRKPEPTERLVEVYRVQSVMLTTLSEQIARISRERDDTVVTLSKRMPQAELAELLDLSQARVSQIVTRRETRRAAAE